MTKRKLDNWLSSFIDWSAPRSETPLPMLRWAGLFTIAAIMKRKVWWSRDLLGGYEIYPTLYVVLVGNPAVVRKSTTIGFSEVLLSDFKHNGSGLTFAGDVTSHSKLLQAIADSPDGSVVVVSSEFSSLLQATPEAMYEILTDLFDNKKELKWSTWAHGDKPIQRPNVNLIAATTPAWISKQPPEYFVGGGFASRILFLYEEEPRQREIFYDHLDFTSFKLLEKDLKEDLQVMATVEGALEFDSKQTKEAIRSWYKEQMVEGNDPRLQGYYGRKHVHALKTSALLSLCERDDKKVTLKHWETAIEMLDYIEKKMSRAFSTLGVNPFATMMEDVLEYVKSVKSATLQQIAGRFYTTGMTLDQLKSALGFLCTAGQLKASGLQNPMYTYNGK